MSAGLITAYVREIQVLRDQETLRRLRRAPDTRIVLAVQPLRTNGVDVVNECGKGCDEALREILVELDLHRLTGVSINGRSS